MPLTSETAEIFVEDSAFTIGDLDDPDHPAYSGEMPTPDVTGLIAAGHGAVQVTCGGHAGDVAVTVETWAEAPAADLDAWQEAGEVSVIWPIPFVQLTGSDADEATVLQITLPRSTDQCFRVRAHALNRDEDDGELHLIQIWPAPPTGDVLLKATDDTGAMWRR